MTTHSDYILAGIEKGNVLLKYSRFEENNFFDKIQRNNFFTLIWITEGSGKIKTGFSEYCFNKNALFTFSPFQPFLFLTDNQIKGIVINFHPDFIFMHRHDREVAFKDVLCDNVNQPPFIRIDDNSTAVFNMFCEKIESEIQNPSLAQNEIVVAYLRILLINASRLKMAQQPQAACMGNGIKEHHILKKLKDAIEENFRTKHSPGDYAAILFVTTKTLAKVSKLHYNKTLSNIINERIITEAKRELYLTNKAIKEIAYDLGYEDEYYFSRFFKVNAQVSPQKYRKTSG